MEIPLSTHSVDESHRDSAPRGSSGKTCRPNHFYFQTTRSVPDSVLVRPVLTMNCRDGETRISGRGVSRSKHFTSNTITQEVQ